MNKISAVIIAKNEEKLIGNALDSLKFCDEIIVIDNGSSDKTKKIAEKYNAKIFDTDTSDFSKMRSLGLEKASNDWILYLDADEKISDELQKNIKQTLLENPQYSAYKLKRKNYYLGKNEWPYIEKLERFFKKENLKGWHGELHESPIIEGKIGELNGFLIHLTHRDLESMLNKTIKWSTTEAILRYNANHPKMSWWRFPRVMLASFLNSYIRQKGFKAGAAGLIESIYQAFSSFITYAKLWELQNKAKIKRTNNEY